MFAKSVTVVLLAFNRRLGHVDSPLHLTMHLWRSSLRPVRFVYKHPQRITNTTVGKRPIVCHRKHATQQFHNEWFTSKFHNLQSECFCLHNLYYYFHNFG